MVKRLNSGFKDYFPSPSENGHSNGGGGSRCIAIDANNNIFVAGTSRLDFSKVFVSKFDADGNMLWQKFWGANTSGLANSAAKAYAMDVCNNKIFVTGATGAGTATEEAMVFLLILNAENGDIDSNTIAGIDPSPSYNDRGYTIKAHTNGDVYIGGWEGADNSGILMKYNYNSNAILWIEKIALGWAARITDIDFDANNNLYLAVDIRGVSTFMGFMKTDTAGNILWANKIQGLENDRNNVSCLRIINNNLYVGGRGAFANFDAEFGDGYLVKTDLSGNLLKVYNYFTGNTDELKCGERLEAFHFYNNGILIAGEAWPKAANIKGEWYIPEEKTLSAMSATATKISNTSIISHDGSFVNGNFSIGTSGASLYNISESSKGSADIIMMHITE